MTARDRIATFLHALAAEPPHAADAAVERVRAAVHIADDEDTTDWQRGYRACSVNALRALGEPAPPAPGIPVPDDSGPADLTGYLAPEPAIGCLSITGAAETDRLAETGIDTPGCDCGHDGMGVSWHGDVCDWKSIPPCDVCGVRGHSFEDCPGQVADSTGHGAPDDWPSRRAGLSNDIAAALYERERPPRDPAWTDAYAMDREVFEAMADSVLPVLYRAWPWLQAEAEDAARTTPKNPAEQREQPAPVEVRDPCPRCESSSDRIPRRLMADHNRDVHPEEQP
jgi:hypothetical protein